MPTTTTALAAPPRRRATTRCITITVSSVGAPTRANLLAAYRLILRTAQPKRKDLTIAS